VKTRSEIRQKIKDLQNDIKAYKHVPKPKRQDYEDIIRGQIRALRWAMGYKLNGSVYWCSSCKLAHKGIECPKCHSSRLVPRQEIPE